MDEFFAPYLGRWCSIKERWGEGETGRLEGEMRRLEAEMR